MNANLCSAAIWPEMGESAALTTGLEAESISAHFLDHLVPHPKRGKYGLYHSPTLSFLSLHCWLRAARKDWPPGQDLPARPAAERPGGQPPPPPPHSTPDCHFDGAGVAAEGREGPSTQAAEAVGGEGGCRAIPGCPERSGSASPRPAASRGSPTSAPLRFQRTRGAQHPGRGS